MDAISFFVPGLPVAQPRQRHAVINGSVRNYLPKTDAVHAFKAAVRLAWPGEVKPLEGAVKVWLVFTFPRPKSKTRKVNSPELKVTKPDLDNCAKSVTDALTGLAYGDDAQIAILELEKFVAGDDCRVGVMVHVMRIPK